MTNFLFTVAMLVTWSTNRMDTLLTPSGDDILRSTISIQTHIYQIPGYAPVTNVVPVLTNTVHLRTQLVEVDPQLPPVPNPYTLLGFVTNNTYDPQLSNLVEKAKALRKLAKESLESIK